MRRLNFYLYLVGLKCILHIIRIIFTILKKYLPKALLTLPPLGLVLLNNARYEANALARLSIKALIFVRDEYVALEVSTLARRLSTSFTRASTSAREF